MTSVRTGPGSAFGRPKALLLCLFAAFALSGMPTFADSVSAGTRLEIRLKEPISSYTTVKGTKISGVLIAPLMPGVNDAPHQVEPLLEAATRAGATSIGGVALHLRGEVKGIFMDWLRTQRPDLVERYERLYGP